LTDPRRDLSPSARAVIGAAMLALGVGVFARGVQLLLVEPNALASEDLLGIPIGMVFALGGLLLAVPPSFPRLRAVAFALVLTVFALAADWIAFGPGPRQFGGRVSLGILGARGHPGEAFGRAVFGAGAVLLDLLAVLAWVRGARKRWKGMNGGETGPRQ
jgi:hypothetical protein